MCWGLIGEMGNQRTGKRCSVGQPQTGLLRFTLLKIGFSYSLCCVWLHSRGKDLGVQGCPQTTYLPLTVSWLPMCKHYIYNFSSFPSSGIRLLAPFLWVIPSIDTDILKLPCELTFFNISPQRW